MCIETTQEALMRMMASSTEMRSQRLAEMKLGRLRAWAANHNYNAVRRTAARRRIVEEALRTAGFQQITLNRSEKHGIWTVEMQTSQKIINPTSLRVLAIIRETLLSIGYSTGCCAVYAVVFQEQVWAGFVLLKD